MNTVQRKTKNMEKLIYRETESIWNFVEKYYPNLELKREDVRAYLTSPLKPGYKVVLQVFAFGMGCTFEAWQDEKVILKCRNMETIMDLMSNIKSVLDTVVRELNFNNPFREIYKHIEKIVPSQYIDCPETGNFIYIKSPIEEGYELVMEFTIFALVCELEIRKDGNIINGYLPINTIADLEDELQRFLKFSKIELDIIANEIYIH